MEVCKRLTTSVLLFFLFVSCTSANPGVETGNPRQKPRTLSGEFASTASSVFVLPFVGAARASTTSGCDDIGGIYTVEARSTDLEDVVSATLMDNHFTMIIEQEKAYYFVMLNQVGSPCGYIDFADNDGGRPHRAIVGGGADAVDIGTITNEMTFSTEFPTWIASHNPADASDADGDGVVDSLDTDVNGDDIEDFDGTYDEFINVLDANDTGVMGACDFEDIRGQERLEFGTVSLTDGAGTLIFTANQNIASLSLSDATLYNVDDESSESLSALSIEITSDGLIGVVEEESTDDRDTALLNLTLTADRDYVLSLPAGNLHCDDGNVSARTIQYYFRPVSGALDCSIGTPDC